MRAKQVFSITLGLWAVGGAIALVHCVGDSPTTNLDGGPDATTDAGNDVTQPPDAGFTLSLAPGHITEDPGDTFPVTINVNRAPSFNDAITFTLTSPPGLTTTQPAPAGTSSLFYVTAPGDAGAADLEIVVTGTNGSIVENAKLGVHIGSLVTIGDGGVVPMPAFASEVDVKMWGAGGGGGMGCQGHSDAGASGGGGGFASARIPVTGGGTYYAFVGTGGGYNGNDCGSGGGGGGYSAFTTADGGVLLLAGGGGGASSVGQYAGAYDMGGPGGAGGGVQGGSGGGTCLGTGGGPDGGGVGNCGGTAGSSLQGGPAASPSTAAGTPGGGAGGGSTPSYGTGAPGGGGGGYYGGGGGGIVPGTPTYSPQGSGAGGGGCGFNPFDGGALTAASGATPANTADPDYSAGVGAGGVHAAGGAGRVLIRFPKP